MGETLEQIANRVAPNAGRVAAYKAARAVAKAQAAPAPYRSPRYIPVADCAKLVRAALKAEFPAVKFSVRSKSYSGGASIDVGWEDGPPEQAVGRVAGRFRGASFDASIDLKTHHESLLDGERVSYGADHVFCRRHETRAMLDQVAAEAGRRYGIAVTFSAYGAWDTGPDFGDRERFTRLVQAAWCDTSGRVVAYAEVR